MRPSLLLTAIASLFIPLSLLGCGGGGGGNSSPQPTSTPRATATATPTGSPLPPLSTPIPLIEGRRVGADYFPAPKSSGATIDGNACEAAHYDFHIHSHLSIFLNGRQIAVPAGIGIKNPHTIVTSEFPDGFVDYGDCVYPLHTHDTSGRLHVEAPTRRTFTLGQAFRVWGQPLSRTNVAGITGLPLVIYINDGTNLRRYEGDPAAIELESKREITFQLGSAIPRVPTFIWYGEEDQDHEHNAMTAARFGAAKR